MFERQEPRWAKIGFTELVDRTVGFTPDPTKPADEQVLDLISYVLRCREQFGLDLEIKIESSRRMEGSHYVTVWSDYYDVIWQSDWVVENGKSGWWRVEIDHYPQANVKRTYTALAREKDMIPAEFDEFEQLLPLPKRAQVSYLK